jgi:methionyl aminopeptidase
VTIQSMDIEGIDSKYSQHLAETARTRTWQAVVDIAAMIKPGMTEKQAIREANEYFASHGVKKFWHRTHIRFGTSTVLSFDDPYSEHVVLGEEDIFFIDVGPVWDGVEGDCGDTFVVGSNPNHLKLKCDVRILFDRMRDIWRDTRVSGSELYRRALKEVESMGYLLHPSYVKGHRLSEFSHAKYTKTSVADLDFCPAPERWVLEFQICDRSLKYGAFIEDLLC